MAVEEFPKGVVLGLACLAVGPAGWYGALRRGLARRLGLAVAAIALGAALFLLLNESAIEIALIVSGIAAAGTLARFAVVSGARLLRLRRNARC